MSDPATPDQAAGTSPGDAVSDVQQRVRAARQSRAARSALFIGGLIFLGMAALMVVAWTVWSHSTPVEKSPDIKVVPAPGVYEPPGRANVPPDVAEAQRSANAHGVTDAMATGKTFTPALIFDKSQPLTAPLPGATLAANVTPAPQPIPYRPEAAKPDPAALERIRNNIRAILEKSSTTRGGIRGVQPDPEGFARDVGYEAHGAGQGINPAGTTSWNIAATGSPGSHSAAISGRDVLSSAAGTANGADTRGETRAAAPELDRDGGEILAQPHRAFGMTEIAMDSDAPSAVIVDVVSGPLTGGRIFGSFSSAYETQTVKFDRLNLHGREIAIEAIAVDLDKLTPALPAETDERYMDRVVLPAATAFMAAAANSFAQPAQTTIINTGLASQTTPARTIREDIGDGVSGAANAAGTVLNAQAAATKRRVWIDALQPIGIWFLRDVKG